MSPFHLPRRQAITDTPEDARLAMQTRYAKSMLEMTPQDGIGIALSYLLMAAGQYPDMLRTVLNEKVVRDGFRGVSMIETLNRISR